MLKPNKLMTWWEMREQFPWRFVFVEVTKSGGRGFEEGIVRFVVETSEIEEMIKYCEEHNLNYVYQWVTGIMPIEPGDYDPDPNVTSERLTREQMQERYPNQWLGLVDVKYQDDDGITVESGVVKYANKTRSQLMRLEDRDEIVRYCTRPDIWLPLGMGAVQ